MRIFTLIIALLFVSFSNAQTDAAALVQKSIKSINASTGYSFDIKSTERVKGKLETTEVTAKCLNKPFKMFALSHTKPNRGAQVLYPADNSTPKALINPGTFLPNLKMDPFGGMMRKGQHHTVFNTGFYFIRDVMQQMLTLQTQNKATIKNFGKVTWNGIACTKIEMINNGFGYKSYTLKSGESLYDLYQSKTISEYLIVQKNSNISSYDDGDAGDKIQIPNSYAKKVIVYLDNSNNHPIYQEIHDDKGLFERYEFTNVVVDPKFANDEFSRDFSGYKF